MTTVTGRRTGLALSSRAVPRAEFDVECRGCGRKWQEVFNFETVIVL